MTPWLGGKSVLIVEDEFLIGLMLIKEITRRWRHLAWPRDVGCRRVERDRDPGPSMRSFSMPSSSTAPAADLAACLDARRIPYVVVSGYDKENLPNGLRRAPFVAKPILVPVLLEAIEGLAAGLRCRRCRCPEPERTIATTA